MDEMKIRTKFMKSIISVIISRSIKKKLKNDILFSLREFEMENDGNDTNVKLGIELKVKTKNILPILEELKVV